jgi:hypothetical protein
MERARACAAEQREADEGISRALHPPRNRQRSQLIRGWTEAQPSGAEVTRRATAATLRRYRAEWQAALARRDYARTRAILGTALDAVSKEASAELETEVRALHGLLALERRLLDIADGEVPARLPRAVHAFAVPSTKRFRGPWDLAVERADYLTASKVLREAIAAISRRMASQIRSQQALISQLRKLQRAPLKFSEPARCALCGGADHPGIDSGTLFICAECIEKATEILAETAAPHDARRAT